MSNCAHWTDCGMRYGGCCALGLYGGRPSPGICQLCPDYAGPSRGLGDTIKRATSAVGIKKPCGGCQKRRQRLNQAVPYRGA